MCPLTSKPITTLAVVPEPYLTYLKAPADGTNPFVYIKGSSVTLVDAAKHDLQAGDVAMTVPDDFPLGTYTVRREDHRPGRQRDHGHLDPDRQG